MTIMSVEARTMLLNRMESATRNILPAEMATEVLTKLADELQEFTVESREGINDPSGDELLQAFLSAKRVEGRSELTLERYETEIRRMMDSVRVPTFEISVYHLRSYLADMKARGVCEQTMDNTRLIFSSYFNWLQRENLIPSNPTVNLGRIKHQIKIQVPYSDIELEKLKTNCHKLRNKAIVLFLNATGCRVGEVVRLNRKDVNFTTLECKVLGKGNKERIVFLDQVTGMVLQEYLNTRKDDHEALFIGIRMERLGVGGIQNMLRTLGVQAGVCKVHPHKFRRTLATNLSSNGMPIQEVAAILGHEKIDTTMRYVCMDKENIHHSYNRYVRR